MSSHNHHRTNIPPNQTHSPQQQTPSSSTTIPQSLMLTDYLRPVFLESNMIREYCLFTRIQQSGYSDNQVTSVTSSNETLQGVTGGVKALTGVYVIPSFQSSYLWFGLLCINNDRSSVPSPWNGGVFRFFIRFPENYPGSGLPMITFLPTTTSTHPLTTPTPTSPHQQYSTITTHPDISPSGQFNIRAYANSFNSSSSTHVPRTYKILRVLRKSFYRQFTDVDVQSSVNPGAAEMCGRDYGEFLRNCGVDAGESLKCLRDVDGYLKVKFKGDRNLILLHVGEGGEEGVNGGVVESGGRGRTLGLSFMC